MVTNILDAIPVNIATKSVTKGGKNIQTALPITGPSSPLHQAPVMDEKVMWERSLGKRVMLPQKEVKPSPIKMLSKKKGRDAGKKKSSDEEDEKETFSFKKLKIV